MWKEIKKSFEQEMKFYPELEHMNINEVVNKYIEHEGDPYSNSCMGAIILHYWPKMNRLFKQSQPYANFDDVYDWITESVLEAIRTRPWLNPSQKIYQDENGPDKVINRLIKQTRANWFQAQNRLTRKINMNILSTDKFQDDYDGMESDQWKPIIHSSGDNINPIIGVVHSLFKSMNYEKAFILDIVVFDGGETEKDLINTFKHKLDNVYLTQFSSRYDLPIEEVEKAAGYIKDKKPTDVKSIVQQRLKEIKTTMNIKDWIHV